MNVFTTHARRYYDRGFNIIPVKGKVPLPKGWSEYKDKRLEPEVLEEWLHNYAVGKSHQAETIGIGIVLGRYGGTAIDIDHEDLMAYMPECSVYKRGLKGMTALFAPCSNQPNETHYKLDILSAGKQTIMPPSKHPSVGPDGQSAGVVYEYVMCSDDFGLKDLEPFPVGTPEFKELVRQSELLYEAHLASGEFKPSSAVSTVGSMGAHRPGLSTTPGRNNHLTAVAYAKACSGEPDSLAIQGLLEEDQRAHGAMMYFSDETEWKGATDPRRNATVFWERAKKAAVKKGLRVQIDRVVSAGLNTGEIYNSGEAKPEVVVGGADVVPEDVALVVNSAGAIMAREVQDLIKDAGPIMELFVNHCHELSKKDLPVLYLGGALAMCATMAGNNVQLNGTWPNLYLFNFAPSGTGKSIPQMVLNDLFVKSGQPRVMGMSQYRSTAGIIAAMVGRPKNVRLDVQDEVGDFFDKLGSQENFKSIVHILSQLWSAGPTSFGETMLADPKKKTEVVFNPSISWCGYCTPSAVRGKLDQDFMRLGLGNRVLYLFQDPEDTEGMDLDALAEEAARRSLNWGVSNDGEKVELNEDLLNAVRFWMNRDPRLDAVKGVYNVEAVGEMKPTNLKVSQGADSRLAEAFKKTYLMKVELLKDDELGDNTWLIEVLNRRDEQIKRLAICHWMSRCGLDCEDAKFELLRCDADWAERFYNMQHQGLKTFANLTFAGELSGMSIAGVLLEEMRAYVVKKPGQLCSEETWRKNFYRLCKKNLHHGKVFNHIQMKGEIEKSLTQSGDIIAVYQDGKKMWQF